MARRNTIFVGFKYQDTRLQLPLARYPYRQRGLASRWRSVWPPLRHVDHSKRQTADCQDSRGVRESSLARFHRVYEQWELRLCGMPTLLTTGQRCSRCGATQSLRHITNRYSRVHEPFPQGESRISYRSAGYQRGRQRGYRNSVRVDPSDVRRSGRLYAQRECLSFDVAVGRR
jgi:hypothetical protein